MALQQLTQKVFDGVVVGFVMIVDGVAPTGVQRRKFDTREEMQQAHERLQDRAFKAGWDEPIPTEFKVRFKINDSETEEEVEYGDFYAPHLKKGVAANKAVCKCGATAWRMGKSELIADRPFICGDCRDQEEMDGITYLDEIDADPRDYPQ